jgi:hypothetical protein
LYLVRGLQLGTRASILAEAMPGPAAHYRPKTRSYKNTPVSILWTYLSHKRWIWSMPAISERSSFAPPTPALALESILKAYVLCFFFLSIALLHAFDLYFKR